MDEKAEKKIKNTEDTGHKTSSTVYVIGGIILLLVVGAGVYFMNKSSEGLNSPEEVREVPSSRPAGGSLKGQKLSDTTLGQSAVLIYPGPMSDSAKAMTSGWNLKTTTLSDGSIQASLIPVGSEAVEGDSTHTFSLKTGDKLYFVDLNPGDDQPGMDNNKNDDIGIVVDANGIIQ